MKILKSFFVGIALLAFAFCSVFLTGVLYRASERMSVKSYIFQINDFANQRVGVLQNLNDISAIELRDKLIKKYVYEYFKVIPGSSDVIDRPILESMSSPEAFEQWQETEAKTITKMSNAKMFRTVYVPDDGIKAIDKPSDYDYYTTELVLPIFYEVRYETATWAQSNKFNIEPVHASGIIFIEALYKPGIRETIGGETFDIKEYLESGKNPVGLFMFKVTNIGNKAE